MWFKRDQNKNQEIAAAFNEKNNQILADLQKAYEKIRKFQQKKADLLSSIGLQITLKKNTGYFNISIMNDLLDKLYMVLRAEERRLEEELARLNDLRSARTALEAIRSSLDTIANYEDQIKRLQGELDELDRLETKELPEKSGDLERLDALYSVLGEIKRLEDAQQQAENEQERLNNILSLKNRLETWKKELEALSGQEACACEAAGNIYGSQCPSTTCNGCSDQVHTQSVRHPPVSRGATCCHPCI